MGEDLSSGTSEVTAGRPSRARGGWSLDCAGLLSLETWSHCSPQPPSAPL